LTCWRESKDLIARSDVDEKGRRWEKEEGQVKEDATFSSNRAKMLMGRERQG